MVKFLIENGADVQAIDNHAIRLACIHNHPEVVKLLIENGANIYANENEGIQIASQEGRLEIIQVLIDKNMDMSSLTLQTRLKIGMPIWETTQENINWRKNNDNECPISREEMTESMPKVGCSQCLNVFKKEVFEEWLNISFKCPLCKNNKFYVI